MLGLDDAIVAREDREATDPLVARVDLPVRESTSSILRDESGRIVTVLQTERSAS